MGGQARRRARGDWPGAGRATHTPHPSRQRWHCAAVTAARHGLAWEGGSARGRRRRRRPRQPAGLCVLTQEEPSLLNHKQRHQHADLKAQNRVGVGQRHACESRGGEEKVLGLNITAAFPWCEARAWPRPRPQTRRQPAPLRSQASSGQRARRGATLGRCACLRCGGGGRKQGLLTLVDECQKRDHDGRSHVVPMVEHKDLQREGAPDSCHHGARRGAGAAVGVGCLAARWLCQRSVVESLRKQYIPRGPRGAEPRTACPAQRARVRSP